MLIGVASGAMAVFWRSAFTPVFITVPMTIPITRVKSSNKKLNSFGCIIFLAIGIPRDPSGR